MGNHTIKFGGFFERAGQNDFDQINVSGVPGGTNNQNGRFMFSDTRTGAPTSGLAIANAALGLFDSYAEIGPASIHPVSRPHVRMVLPGFLEGHAASCAWSWVRYTIMQPYYYSLWRNMVVFDPSRYDPCKRCRNGSAHR